MEPRLTAGGTLVKGLLDEGAMSVIYAPSNVGKSFLALDLAFHIATGKPWRGHKIQKPGAVLYLAAEGGYGFVNRVVAKSGTTATQTAPTFPWLCCLARSIS